MNIIEGEKFEIHTLINQLCVVDQNKITAFSTNDAFRKIQNYHELFHEISIHCTIYDYGLLEAFVESTDCEEAIKVLDTFTGEMHNSILKELNLIKDCGQKLNPDDSMSGTYKFAIEYIGGQCTLKTQATIQNVIREHFHLQKGTIIFKGIEISSIIFIYHISAAVRSYLLQYQLDYQNLSAFAKHNISCLIIDGIKKETLLQWSKKVSTYCSINVLRH